MLKPVLRFAPSPNGLLHLGHAYSALFTARCASDVDCRFLVRIEDIDIGRSKPEFTEAIFEDLHWLGLEWEEVAAQIAEKRYPNRDCSVDRRGKERCRIVSWRLLPSGPRSSLRRSAPSPP